MATAKTDVASHVAHYAGIFHDVIGDGHHVASPLGAWLLLALCAPAATGASGETLTEVLGGGAYEVASSAADLLADPHPLVSAAAAVWSRQGAADEDWLVGLPSAVTKGDIPDQGELDRWAREQTYGLIDRFPLRVSPLTYLVLATALATKVSWDTPFDLVPGSALGRSSRWSGRLAQVLRQPKGPGHRAFVAISDRAGDVAVHIGRARGGLSVVSVIAAAGVASADVLAVAHQIAIASARGEPVPRRALPDLAPGDSELWSVRDEPSAGAAGERCQAVLPAWSATDSYDLSDPRLGFAAAAASLAGDDDPWQARQAVTATYSKVGFEAAAVTAVAVAAAMMPRGGMLRTVELRFGHPYAVVAVTASDQASGPWQGIPVFSAWITDPCSAA